ncbi:helix-turn-helix domain-containing protein [Castellaniella sp.]|uniref:helix-turn-helix domain-containing protein n=1 Tax=Castellaniella sp. TaxID=1955812 RepID=UPI0035649CE5
MNTFGERLRYARELRGLSQKQLADACGLSQSAISSYERGSRKSTQKLLVIARKLEVDLYWLDGGTGHMRPAGQSRLAMGESWPFPSIPPEHIMALSENDRLAVEKTLRALIDSLLPRLPGMPK